MSAEPTFFTTPRTSRSVTFTNLPPRSQRAERWRGFERFMFGSLLNLAGFVIVLMFLFLAIFGAALSPHDPYAPPDHYVEQKLQPPSLNHPLGTDELGRDLLSRIMTGARVSLQAAVVVLALAVSLGTLIGAVSGYLGGLADEVLMRVTDMFLAFPAFILAIAIAASLGRDLRYTTIALSTVFWPWYARLVRGQVLSIKEREYVEAARCLGMSAGRLMFRHILPNAIAVVIIQITIDIGYVILSTSALSFIGLGAQPPTPEWGTMLASARPYFRDAWWYMTFPGVALTLTVFAFNALGDGLRDTLDPRSRQR